MSGPDGTAVTSPETAEAPTAPKHWRRSVRLVFAAAGVAYLAVGLTIPVLPGYVTGTLHGSAAEAGWVMGGYTVTAVLSRPVAGLLLDRLGPRGVLSVGMFLMGASTLGYAVSTTLPVLLACRLLLGVGLGATLSAATVWMVLLAPPERQTWAIGLVGLVNYLVLAAGAPVGQLLADHLGLNGTWVIAGAMPLLAVPLLVAVPSRRRPPASGSSSGGAFAATVRPGTAMALAAFGYAVVISFAVTALTRRGVEGATAVVTGYALAMVVIRLVSGRIRSDFTSPRALGGVLAAELVGILLIGGAHSLALAVLGAVLVAVGMAQSYPALGTLVARSVDDDRRSTALASYGAYINIGIGLGNLVLGKVAATVGTTAMFLTAAAALAGATILGSCTAHRSGTAT
ncbi:MFS transporter [Streptomyces sp. NPDC004682]